MRKEKTIREITEEFGVTRRAIQGYEKAGIVTASGKNKYGHLLYDEEALKTILKTKQYQEFGFSIREIMKFTDASVEFRKEMLEKQIIKMQMRQIGLEKALSEMKQMMKQLEETVAKEKNVYTIKNEGGQEDV